VLPPGGARLRTGLAPLSTLRPAGRVSEHCPAGLRALSDASGNRGAPGRDPTHHRPKSGAGFAGAPIFGGGFLSV